MNSWAPGTTSDHQLVKTRISISPHLPTKHHISKKIKLSQPTLRTRLSVVLRVLELILLTRRQRADRPNDGRLASAELLLTEDRVERRLNAAEARAGAGRACNDYFRWREASLDLGAIA